MAVFVVDTTVPYLRHTNGMVEFWYKRDGKQLSNLLHDLALNATAAVIEAAVQERLTLLNQAHNLENPVV